MKPTIIFIHTAGPQGLNQGSTNLIAYLEEELMDKYNFIHIKMPTPENPKYMQWKEQIEKELSTQTGEVILVGHSLGGSILLKFLSEESYPIKLSGLFVVSAPFWGIDEDWQGSDFILKNKFEQNLNEIPFLFLYHSRDDDTVPFSHHIAYAKKLPQGIKRELEGAQHLFQNGLPELTRDIRSLKMNYK